MPPTTPFTRRDALRASVTPRQLRGYRYRRLLRGIYVPAGAVPSVATRGAAALLACPPASHLSHLTAAQLWGAVVPTDPRTHVSSPAHRANREGIASHRAAPSAQVVLRHGLRVSSPVQSFLDCAALLPLVDLVVLGDSLVARGVLRPAELATAAASWTGRGRRQARRAAALVRAGVDSPMETRLRLLIVLAGLPEPVVDHRVLDPDGRLRMRFDLSYPAYRLVVEYDGRQHAESDAQWAHDLTRREALDDDGWRIVVLRASDVFRTPGQTLARLVRVMRSRGMPVPARLDPRWELHFPELGAGRSLGP